jgi:tetratricopeptide (TPR) repeat protein
MTAPTACRRQTKEEKSLRAELRTALDQKDYQHASALARRLIEIAPHDDGSWDRLLHAYLGSGDIPGAKRALASWRVAVEKPSPKVDEYGGDVALAEGDPATAIQFWHKVLAAQPKSAGRTDSSRGEHLRVLQKIASAASANRDWKEENSALSQMITTEDSAVPRIQRALCLRHLHEWDNAYADLHRAQQLAPDDPEVVRATHLFERIGKFLAEIRELDARLVLSPQDFGLLGDRALLSLRSDDSDLAFDDAESASKLAPWAVRPKLFAAIAMLEAGKPDECEKLGVEKSISLRSLAPEFLETISRLDSELSAERNNAEIYVSRAWQLNDIGQPRLALDDAENACRLDPQSGGGHAEGAYALAKLGKSDDALQRIRVATDADTNFSTAWQYRGELEMSRGDYLSAAESLSRALAINATAAALQKREECYRHLGLFVKADQDHRALDELNGRGVK